MRAPKRMLAVNFANKRVQAAVLFGVEFFPIF
jgi:hypothetical protein